MRREIWRQTWQDFNDDGAFFLLIFKYKNLKWQSGKFSLNRGKLKNIHQSMNWRFECPFHQLMWHFFFIFQAVTQTQFGLIIETFSFPFWLTWLTSSSISNYKEVDLFMETAKKPEQHINYFLTLMKQQCCCWMEKKL